MITLFEQQGGQYEMQGDYKSPCVELPQGATERICYPVTKEFREKLYGAILEMHKLDKELEQRGLRFTRYADDMEQQEY